jgi:hypothetical protein
VIVGSGWESYDGKPYWSATPTLVHMVDMPWQTLLECYTDACAHGGHAVIKSVTTPADGVTDTETAPMSSADALVSSKVCYPSGRVMIIDSNSMTDLLSEIPP